MFERTRDSSELHGLGVILSSATNKVQDKIRKVGVESISRMDIAAISSPIHHLHTRGCILQINLGFYVVSEILYYKYVVSIQCLLKFRVFDL